MACFRLLHDDDDDDEDPGHVRTSAEVSVRLLGTSAELSGHMGTNAKVSCGHFDTMEDISALGNTGPVWV